MRLIAFQPDIALNLGALIRIAVCFEMRLEVIEPCGFPFSIKAVRRSAMDYAEQVDLRRHRSWAAFDAERGAAGREPGRLLLLTTKTLKPYHSVQFKSGDALLVGRESAGAPPEVHAAADEVITIPMAPGARSLNVATAAAIVAAEARRQVPFAAAPPLGGDALADQAEMDGEA